MLLPVGILISVSHRKDIGTACETLIFWTIFSGYRIGALDVNKSLYIMLQRTSLCGLPKKSNVQGFKFEYRHRKIPLLKSFTVCGWPNRTVLVRCQPGDIFESLGVKDNSRDSEGFDNIYMSETRWRYNYYNDLLEEAIACYVKPRVCTKG